MPLSLEIASDCRATTDTGVSQQQQRVQGVASSQRSHIPPTTEKLVTFIEAVVYPITALGLGDAQTG